VRFNDDGAAEEQPPAPAQKAGAPRMFVSVGPWVQQWLAPMIVRRDDAEFRWCPQWWRHAEPLSRLTGLWRAWESCHGDPDQVNQWWLEHFDPHMKVLTAANGPFGACSQGKGHQGDAAGLKVEPMPADWLNFTPPRAEATPVASPAPGPGHSRGVQSK